MVRPPMARATWSMRMPCGRKSGKQMSARKMMVTSGTRADDLDEGRAEERGRPAGRCAARGRARRRTGTTARCSPPPAGASAAARPRRSLPTRGRTPASPRPPSSGIVSSGTSEPAQQEQRPPQAASPRQRHDRDRRAPRRRPSATAPAAPIPETTASSAMATCPAASHDGQQSRTAPLRHEPAEAPMTSERTRSSTQTRQISDGG